MLKKYLKYTWTIFLYTASLKIALNSKDCNSNVKKPSNVNVVSISTVLFVECLHSAHFGTDDRLGNQPVKSAHVSPFPGFKYYNIIAKLFNNAFTKEKQVSFTIISKMSI